MVRGGNFRCHGRQVPEQIQECGQGTQSEHKSYSGVIYMNPAELKLQFLPQNNPELAYLFGLGVVQAQS